MAGREQDLGVGGVVGHLHGAVVQIDAGIPPDMGLGDELQHFFGSHPQAGAQTGGPLEDVIEGGGGIEGHEAAHAGAADQSVLPVRQGPEIAVDIGLQLLDEPVHIALALTLDPAKLGILKGHRGVLPQAAVPLPVALDAHKDQLLAAFLHVVVHAPGGAVGGILVKKHVVSVKEIHNRVSSLRVLLIAFRQIDIGLSHLVPGELRYGNVPFDNHNVVPLYCKIYQNSIRSPDSFVKESGEFCMSDKCKNL